MGDTCAYSGLRFLLSCVPRGGSRPWGCPAARRGREVPRQPRRKCSCSAAEAGRNDLTTGCDQKLRDVLCPFCGAGSCDQRTEEPQLPVSCCFPSRYLQEHLADVWNGENCVSLPRRGPSPCWPRALGTLRGPGLAADHGRQQKSCDKPQFSSTLVLCCWEDTTV